MGCLRRVIIAGIIVWQLVTFMLALVVLGSAGMLGKAALMSANDAIVLFVLNAGGLAGTLALVVFLWSGGRRQRRLLRDLAASRTAAPVRGG